MLAKNSNIIYKFQFYITKHKKITKILMFLLLNTQNHHNRRNSHIRTLKLYLKQFSLHLK